MVSVFIFWPIKNEEVSFRYSGIGATPPAETWAFVIKWSSNDAPNSLLRGLVFESSADAGDSDRAGGVHPCPGVVSTPSEIAVFTVAISKYVRLQTFSKLK